MIKRYNQFIKESNWYQDLELEEIIEEIGSETGMSYSELCKTNQDPEKDFETFQKHLDETGWTIDKIRKEHTNEQLISLYRNLDGINGLVDIYFFFLFKKLGLKDDIVSLGGVGWEDYHVVEDEAFIRYSYGYHNTKYGLLAILNFGTVDEFIKQAMTHLQEYLYSDLPSNILEIYDEKGGFRRLTGDSSWNIINIRNYSISEEDRFIIFTKEIAEFLNQFPLEGQKGTLSDVMEISPEDISEKISKFLENMNLDIDFTGNELIIWGEFKES